MYHDASMPTRQAYAPATHGRVVVAYLPGDPVGLYQTIPIDSETMPAPPDWTGRGHKLPSYWDGTRLPVFTRLLTAVPT